MPDACYRCGENTFDYVEGQVICKTCGTVVEESNIVSDVTFVEGGDGSSSVVGQFVSDTGRQSYGGRGLPGVQRPTREITLANGRRRISQLAQALQLKSQHVDAAQRLFMLAVQHNFTQGRRSQHVVAACLYIVCRRLKTPHMLIDFSDVLQINVFVLGQTFLRLCQVLSIQPPVVDPSLYIHRFAAKLDFEDQEHEVATTALRIVQRMNRDWLQTGRRPAGICGAALMIAARLHGFQRSQREIVVVVNICEMTLRKRLIEFENTPAAEQTFDEFQDETKDNELPASDPPSFRRARLMEELEQLKKAATVDKAKIEDILAKIRAIDRPPRVSRSRGGEDSDESDEESEEPVAEPKKSARTTRARKASTKEDEEKDGERSDAEDSASEFGDEEKPTKARIKKKKRKATSDISTTASSKRRKTKESEASGKKETKSKKADRKKGSQKLQIDEEQEEDPDTVAKEMQRIMQSQDTAQATQEVGSLQSQAASSTNATQTTQLNESVGNDDGDFQDIDDAELDVYFNTETEKDTKTSIWEEVNRDWIEAQAEKAKLKAAQAEAEAQAGGAKAKKPSKRKKQQNGAATAGEAASTTIQKKVPQKSDRINYSAIKMDALFERLGRDAAAADGAAPTLLPPPPAAQRRRYVSSLGEIVESNTSTAVASTDTSMKGLSSEFVAPVTAYRTKSSGFMPLAPQVSLPSETAEGAEAGGEFDEGEGDGEYAGAEGEGGEYEGDDYAGGEDYAQDDYEAEFARMRQTTNDEEEYYYGQDDYY